MTNGPVIEIRQSEALHTMTCGRVALFSAPCGFGKTVASRARLPGTKLRPAPGGHKVSAGV